MSREFKGMFCPIVTPFKADQSIDFDALYKVIDYVIDNGIDGILMCGGTGEYHAMSLEEQKDVLKKGIAHVDEYTVSHNRACKLCSRLRSRLGNGTSSILSVYYRRGRHGFL